MRRVSFGVTFVVTAAAVLLLSASPSSQGRRNGRHEVESIGARDAVAREVLVKLHDPLQPGQLGQLATDIDAESLQPVGRSGIFRVVSRTRSAAALVAALRNRTDVAFAEPNYIVHALSDPSDPLFPQLWGLKNIGQPVNGGAPGTAGADMRAAEAWSYTVGSAANVVAILDTGIDYTHTDIAPNMWSAPAAFTVVIGGVPITCQAGTHGFNAITRTCDPMDDHNHGTHVAGTIGAAGNNANGVTGVNWVTSMMGLKFLDSSGSGTTADAIDLIDFARQVKQIFAASGGANIRVLNNSWGGGDFTQALLDQINGAAAEEMLFVAAAGNNGLPNDIFPAYPASYAAPNVIAVAATTNTDARPFFSNYGVKTVHLGAPGADILSTQRNGAYGFSSGTSMAAPHVSGAAALTLSHCVLDTTTLKSALVDTVDQVPSMLTKTISGGRLNVLKALESCSEPPGVPTNVVASGGDRQVRLTWSAAERAITYRVKRSTNSGGPYTTVASNIKALQFTDTGLNNGTTYYYVVSAVNFFGESANSVEASATPKLPADLVVSVLTVPGFAAAGGPLTVSVTTKNQGTGSADPSTTRFYVSPNISLDATDTILTGVQTVPALAPGAISATSVTLELPNLPPESYYLIAKADGEDLLFESSESNNTYSRRFSVGPDLLTPTFDIPSTGAPGASVDASYAVRNQGAVGAGPSVLDFYWSTNTSIDGSDTLVGRINIGPLGPNATQSGQTSVVIPSDATLGTYYVIARADSANSIEEASESNNTSLESIQVGGDLTVTVSVPQVLGAGVPFDVTDTTKNSGTISVGQSATQFYLSVNSSLSADDVLLGTRTVNTLTPGEVSVANTPVTIPSGTTPGSYYLFAKADAANAVTETQEGNNTDWELVSVGADLKPTISTLTSPVTAGNTTLVSESVTNRGGNDAAPSIVKYYLSLNNASLDAADIALTETRSVGLLIPGATSSAQTPVRIPAGTAPGLYYLIVQADGGGTIAESSETNNTHARSIRVN
jgi:subtilisin family serine protease